MKRPGTVSVLCALMSLATLGCGSEDTPSSELDEASHEQKTHWAYSGAEGPEYWGSLSEDFALCGDGRYQSPVNFPQTLPPRDLVHLEFDYTETSATMIDNGHTIVVEPDEDSNELLVDGEVHSLLQFHFHAQSEHQVDGKVFPLELHLVHASKSGKLAVVGVFFEAGAANEPLGEVFDKMEDSSEDPLLLESNVDLLALLPAQRLGWNYSGSLTTPPCTEGVAWNVHATPSTASAAQLEAFSKLHPGSYRPVGDNVHIDELLDELTQD